MTMDKPYSQHTAQMIDEEVRTLIDTAYKGTHVLLEKHREDVEKVFISYLYYTENTEKSGMDMNMFE